MPVDVRLRRLPIEESEALLAGRGAPPVGIGWDPDYPTEDTFIALALLRLAHDAAGSEADDRAAWWLHQIVVSGSRQDLVVGDIGFHGPPEDGAPAVVEIGYHVVPGWRGRGVATRSCGLLLDIAWRGGAGLVRAEAAAEESRTVLRRNGFRPVGDSWFEVVRP